MGTNHFMDLYLVRHGITRWNKEKRYLGHTDEPLLESEISTLTPLRKAINRISFDKCFCSDLRRCIRTSRYVVKDQPVCSDNRLRELHFGDWEGMTYDQLKGDVNYRDWLDNWERVAPPNGESFEKFNKRIEDFLAELFLINARMTSTRNIFICTHGGVIRLILMKLAITKTLWEIPIDHAKAYRLTLQQQRGKWLCNSWSVVPTQENEQSYATNIIT